VIKNFIFIRGGIDMKKWEEVFKDIQELSNGERIKLLDKLFDTYFDSRPSKEILEKEKFIEMWGEDSER
jgi:N-acetylneuraminic acid mutarotase